MNLGTKGGGHMDKEKQKDWECDKCRPACVMSGWFLPELCPYGYDRVEWKEKGAEKEAEAEKEGAKEHKPDAFDDFLMLLMIS